MWMWFLGIFSGFMTINSAMYDQNVQSLKTTEHDLQQRAVQTVQYMNVINDWRYIHPDKVSGTISNDDLGWRGVNDIKNILVNGRAYVYQPNKQGLISSLFTASNSSFLIGTVKNRRIYDTSGNDMGVSVPDVIPNDYIVYLN